MWHVPHTRYATVGDADVAYQVCGDGPDLVFLPDWYNHLEAQWEEPVAESFLRALARAGRLIQFDKRGTGLSDPVPLRSLPTLDEWAGDLVGVLDEVGSESASLVCASGGAALGLLVAASAPERVRRLVVIDGSACSRRKPGYPPGAPQQVLEAAAAWILDVWGTGRSLELLAPSLLDQPGVLEWRARLERVAASPGTVRRMQQSIWDIDVRTALPLVRAQTLVVHRDGDRWARVDHGRYLAENIDGATYVEIDGGDHLWFGDGSDEILDHTLRFVADAPIPRPHQPVLTTIMFTDIVESTRAVAALGDVRWEQLLARHDRIAERHVRRCHGEVAGKTGDGLLLRFPGPGHALQCAEMLHDMARSLGLQLRVGVHTGECLVSAEGVRGIAVHVAARVCAVAAPGATYTTNTVRELGQGADLTFHDAGDFELKGTDGPWRLFRVTSPGWR